MGIALLHPSYADYLVGVIHESPERIGAMKMGGQFVNCPYVFVLSVFLRPRGFRRSPVGYRVFRCCVRQ